jgi:hypothetical protein
MPDEAKRKAARKAVRSAQAGYEKDVDAARDKRRQTFADAQKAGLSLQEIAEEIGLHRSRVAQIIRGE